MSQDNLLYVKCFTLTLSSLDPVGIFWDSEFVRYLFQDADLVRQSNFDFDTL